MNGVACVMTPCLIARIERLLTAYQCSPEQICVTHKHDAVTNLNLELMTYGLLAPAISRITDINFIQLLLAFIPGGQYKVTLLALIFGFDVAFVAFHHTSRVIMVCIGLPLIAGFQKKSNQQQKD